MRRYIDADKLQKDGWSLQRTKHSLTSNTYEVMGLDCVPTADVVEVVRCKDCKYRSKIWYEDKRKKEGGYWIIGCNNDNIAERVYGLAHDDDYCSYGERAEE